MFKTKVGWIVKVLKCRHAEEYKNNKYYLDIYIIQYVNKKKYERERIKQKKNT